MTTAFGNSYGYDANGNQTSRVISGTTHTLTYDFENRLTAVTGAEPLFTMPVGNGQRVRLAV